MEKLKNLRKLYNYKQKDLAVMLGVKPKDISDWELNKSQPELKMLRDIAVIFGTSVYDLLNNDVVTITSWKPWNTDERIDSFWGHIGILLYNSYVIKWYPITSATANKVECDLHDDQPDTQTKILAVETLNNRVLFINKSIIKKISLLGDSSDMPKDWELPWDGYQGLGAEEYYNLIKEYFFNYEHFCENTSEQLQIIIDELIKKNRITDDNVLELINDVYIYFHDNTTETISIGDASALLNSIMDIEFEMSRFIHFEDLNGEIHFIPIENIGLIDTPLYLYKTGFHELINNE
ncbi:helix-turn-helix transcriptional regulator [Snodgrassella communis]|uniref:helix-turn-helix transcriptional regulator n=1 Tax=Snodgrassella communis TaxID=2946699 RepID=UPI001EF5697A|nr:helix-turn-helix transcriptional regulator [Snodgrassella communis]